MHTCNEGRFPALKLRH